MLVSPSLCTACTKRVVRVKILPSTFRDDKPALWKQILHTKTNDDKNKTKGGGGGGGGGRPVMIVIVAVSKNKNKVRTTCDETTLSNADGTKLPVHWSRHISTHW